MGSSRTKNTPLWDKIGFHRFEATCKWKVKWGPPVAKLLMEVIAYNFAHMARHCK